jgi:putative transposase
MFRISQFHALLKGVPRQQFDRIVREHQADRYTKRFGSWDQLVAMVFAQCMGADSLRALEAGFNPHRAHHYHLRTSLLRRSTLAEANARRDPAIFEALARVLMGQASRRLRRESEQLLYLLDSTSLTLKGPGFDAWTAANATRRTQGLKVHVLYQSHTQTPAHVQITAPNVNDLMHGRSLDIQSGATYVFDKGYCDYAWWHQLNQRGARFVTRFKHDAGLLAEASCPVPPEQAHTIVADERVRFRYRHPGGQRRNPYTQPLRRITVARPHHPTPLVLATNDLDSPAADIAELYKDRWQIELFFKWVKQHLKLRRFLGRTQRAVRTQILTALITYLLLALYKARNKLKDSLWMILSGLRVALFQRPLVDRACEYRRRCRASAIAKIQGDFFL